jgi:hypothetical protein
MKTPVNTTNAAHHSGSPEEAEQLHLRVAELLPWYINQSLSSDEESLVATHLNHCQLCQQALANELVMVDAFEPRIPISSVDSALEKMMTRIESSTSANSAVASNHKAANLFQRHFGQRFSSVISYANSLRKKCLRPISIPMVWFVLPQAITVGFIAWSITDVTNHNASYRALSSSTIVDGQKSTPLSSNLVIVFKPTATHVDITSALQRYDARIVDGPTVTHAYLLHVPNEHLEQALNALRKDNNVELVDRLNAGDRHDPLAH